jgi:hypothetical protein
LRSITKTAFGVKGSTGRNPVLTSASTVLTGTTDFTASSKTLCLAVIA